MTNMIEKKEKSGRHIGSDSRHRPTLDLSRTVVKGIFEHRPRPWDALPHLQDYIRSHGDALPYDEYDEIAENVWVHVSAYVSPTCRIDPPAIICGGAKLRHFSHVEGSVIGAFATVGEMCQVKNSIIFDRSTLKGHNSVNTALLGYEALLGEGCIVSDARLDGLNVTVDMPEGIYVFGKDRLGAIICDGVKVGASCVINPGTVIDIGSTVLPLTSLSGYVYPYTTVK